MATASTVLNSRGPVPFVAFSTNGARFTSGSGPDSEEDWISMRVVIAELAHAQWGVVASEMDSTSPPVFTMMIDHMFWFEANEVIGIVQIARISAVPNGSWMFYRFNIPDALDFADCVRAIAEAKSQVLYHRLRMIDVLVDVFEEQFRTPAVTHADHASAPEEPTASSSAAAGEVAENRDEASAPLPQPGPTVGNPFGPVSP